jgi:hypothetical protein
LHKILQILFFKNENEKKKILPLLQLMVDIGLFFFFLTQFCDVAQVVIIHEDNLASFGYITRGVWSHCGIAICIKKVSEGKRRIMKTKIFHHAKI